MQPPRRRTIREIQTVEQLLARQGHLRDCAVQGLDLRVHIHGPALDAGFIGLSGKSWVDMPTYAASVNRSVAVSLDDPTFANAVPARIDSSGTRTGYRGRQLSMV